MRDLFRGYFMGMVLAGLTVVGCATAFPWRYYATEMNSSCYDSGKLLGKEGSGGWPDISLKECKPDPDSIDPRPGDPKPIKLKCITVLVDDWYSLKGDNIKCHADLQKCQQGPHPQ